MNFFIINDFSQRINYYPNPTNDFITIDLSQKYQGVEYLIYKLNGQLVKEKSNLDAHSFVIDFQDLNYGMYFIIVKQKQNKSFLSVIKK